MKKKCAWKLLIAGLVLMFIDFASYGFKYVVADITLLGWIIYGLGFALLLTGIYFVFIARCIGKYCPKPRRR